MVLTSAIAVPMQIWHVNGLIRPNLIDQTMPSSRIPPAPATHPLMVVIICGKYGNNRCRTEKVTERTRFSKSRSNDLEDIGQGQRSSHATHLLMLVIICIKYRKNPSRTVDATERTLFSRPRPNDFEDIGQICRFWKKCNTRHTLL